MLEKAVQAAIYEKALKNHYIEILYIDFEDTGKCIKLHQDTKLLSGENIFPESDEQMFDDYIHDKIMCYASGDLLKTVLFCFVSFQKRRMQKQRYVMILFLLPGDLQM